MEYDFVSELDQEYLCFICHGVLRDPHATDCCGQHFCEKCLKEWFRQEGRAICPHCRSTRFNHMRYLPLKRKIDGFQVFCSNKGQGCQVVSTVGELSSHLGKCPYSRVPCSHCQRALMRKYFDFHRLHECPKRIVNCVYCGVAGEHAFITSEQHQARCPDYPVGCPRKCESGQDVRRKELKSHANVCPLEPVCCKDCKRTLLRVEFSRHVEKECEFRLIHCLYCNRQGTYKAITQHTKICDEAPAKCPNNCGQDLKRKQLVNGMHNQVCPLQPLKCAKCMANLVRKEVVSHNQSYCPKRIIPCDYCCQGIPHDELPMHVQEVCGEYPLGCPRNCDKSAEQLKRKNLMKHAEICPLEPVKCPYYEVGCETEVVRKELSSHMESYRTQHLTKLTEAHEKQSNELKKQAADLNKARQQNAKLRQQNARLREDHSMSIAKHDTMNSSLSIEVNWIRKQNPSGKFMQSYRCLKAIVDPKIMDENDVLAFRVPPISHSWTSPPFYLFSAGYKMKISFIAEASKDNIVASLYLLKRENDSELKWPLEEQYKIKLKVNVKPKPISLPSRSHAHHSYTYAASQPPQFDDYDTYSNVRSYYDDDYSYPYDDDTRASDDDDDDYSTECFEVEVPLYHCSHCDPWHRSRFDLKHLRSTTAELKRGGHKVLKKCEHEMGHIVVSNGGPWVAEVSLSKHVHKFKCSNCDTEIIEEGHKAERKYSLRSVCESCEESRRWEEYHNYYD